MWLIDCGNTRLKVARRQDGRLQRFSALPRAAIESSPDPIVLLPTAQGREANQDQAWLEDLPADRVQRVRHGLGTLRSYATHGLDRLMGAYGARALGLHACLIVDAGTAVTVDRWYHLQSDVAAFDGGCIAPGAGLGGPALEQAAPALPPMSPDWQADSVLAASTEGGIAAALAIGWRAQVHGLIAAAQRERPRVRQLCSPAAMLRSSPRHWVQRGTSCMRQICYGWA